MQFPSPEVTSGRVLVVIGIFLPDGDFRFVSLLPVTLMLGILFFHFCGILFETVRFRRTPDAGFLFSGMAYMPRF